MNDVKDKCADCHWYNEDTSACEYEFVRKNKWYEYGYIVVKPHNRCHNFKTKPLTVYIVKNEEENDNKE